MRIPNHDTFPLKIACVSASARVPNSFVCDSKRQAAELRRTGREVARGFERKNWRCFPPETSPLVFVALLPLFSLSTQQKLLAFEHGRDRYKLRRATLDRPCKDTDICEFSPWALPAAPLYLVLGSIQQCSPREYLIEINHRWKGPIAVRVGLHMARGVTLKEKIQHGATHATELTWLLQFLAAVRSRFPPKRLQAGSANVDKGSSVAVQANISNSKAVESYNSCRYWGGETVHLIWSQKIVPWEQDGV